MSRETLTTLNQNVLIGYTSKRGQAWHYRASEQGAEPNHYENAIPVEDVRRRLFSWTPVEGPVETTILTADGVTRIVDPERKTIVRPDTQTILGVFKSGYTVRNVSRADRNAERVVRGQVAAADRAALEALATVLA